MLPVDFVKALCVAIAILVLDLAAAFGVVWFYSLAIDPGHARDYYVALAPAISTVSTRIIGPILFLLFVWRVSRRRPDRNPWTFAFAVFAFYLIVDGALVAYRGFFIPAVIATMALKLFGALIGAWLARLRRR
ncbi:MAG TPA: hypothetical protein VNS79_14330 [Sphingobium sp.]|nr:hypothetical protein [Sphingobium sp.]